VSEDDGVIVTIDLLIASRIAAALHEVKGFCSGFEGLGTDSAFSFGDGFVFGDFGLALGFVGAVTFATDGAVTEFGDGAEEAAVFVWVTFEGGAENSGIQVHHELDQIDGRNMEDCLVNLADVAGIDIGKEVEGEFDLAAVGLQLFLFTEPILVTSGFPGADTFLEQALAVLSEVFDDFGVLEAVEKHLINLVSDDFREVGNFAVSAAAVGFR